MSVKPVSPLNLDRYELKYVIPFSMVEPISRYVEQYCEMDYYSQVSHDGFYVINSLYLDTSNLLIFRRQQDIEFDYSCFRIRSYGNDPRPPYFLESKQKVRDFCKKRRGKIPIENLSDLFHRPSEIKGFDPYADKNVAGFLEKSETFGLEPKVLTQYRRKAYLSTCDDYARVTFDRDMRYMEETSYNVIPDESLMSHYDHAETFEYSGTNVVLELKCERKIPIWMIQLVRGFELNRHSYSKYHSSMIEMHGAQNRVYAFDWLNGRDHSGLSLRPSL
jgi:hypothetical protein